MNNQITPNKIISFISNNNLEVSHLMFGNNDKRIELEQWIELLSEFNCLDTPYSSGSKLKIVCKNSSVFTFEF